VLSVTSETPVNLSLQSAPSRSAKADPVPAPDSFSSLIDNNAAEPASSDRAAAPDRPAPQPRSDSASAASDNRQPRDTAPSSNNAAKPASQDSEPAAQPVTVDAGADAGAASKPVKPGATKSGVGKPALQDSASDIVPAADAATSADPAAPSQPTAPQAAATAPVAVAIAAPVAVTDIVAAPGSSGSTIEPLAIAAAAIATSTSTVEASRPTATPVQGQINPEKPAPAAATTAVAAPALAATPAPATIAATPATSVTDPAAATAVTAQAAASDVVATPVNQPALKADTVAEADPQLAAVVAAATPAVAVAPKPASKAPAAARAAESAVPVKTGIAPNAADPSVASPSTDAGDKNVAPQIPVADGKPKTDGVTVEAAKPEPAKLDVPVTAAATTAPHEHRASTAAPVQTDISDSGQAANAIQQPQAPSASTPVPATQLSVTAATAAAVPLNGLALQIAVSAQSGKSRFEIRLDPAELGRIDVRIDVDRHGQVTSHLTVEKPETLAMLRQDAPQLQRALDNAGFKTGDSGLQFSLRDQSSSGQNSGDETNRNAQRLIISEDDTVPAAVAGRTYGRMLGSSSGVDIRV
jgi:flagellar hook-length control protein FliK